MPSPAVTLTGGATGIGAAVVDQLREQDATVYVLDVADAPERDGVHTIHCDLADAASIDAAVGQDREIGFGGGIGLNGLFPHDHHP